MLREAELLHMFYFFLYIFLHVLTFHFFFVTDSCRFKELTCAFKARQRLNLTCPARDRIWHARHAGDFGTRGMLGINFLLEPRLLATLVGRSRNLKICS